MPQFAHHGTLTANTVTSVTLTSADGGVEVINRDGSAEIYFTIGSEPAPTVGGDDCFVVPALIGGYIAYIGAGSVTVQLISSGAPKFSVLSVQS